MVYYNPQNPYTTGFSGLMKHIGEVLMPAIYRKVLTDRLQNILSPKKEKTVITDNKAKRGLPHPPIVPDQPIPLNEYKPSPPTRGEGGSLPGGDDERDSVEQLNKTGSPLQTDETTTVNDTGGEMYVPTEMTKGSNNTELPPFIPVSKEEKASREQKQIVPYVPPPAPYDTQKLKEFYLDLARFPDAIRKDFEEKAQQLTSSSEPEFNEKRFVIDKDGNLKQLIYDNKLGQYVSAPVVTTSGEQHVAELPKYDKDRIRVVQHPQTGEAVIYDLQDGTARTVEGMPLENFDYEYALDKMYKEGQLSLDEYALKLKELDIMSKIQDRQTRMSRGGYGRAGYGDEGEDEETAKLFVDRQTGEIVYPEEKDVQVGEQVTNVDDGKGGIVAVKTPVFEKRWGYNVGGRFIPVDRVEGLMKGVETARGREKNAYLQILKSYGLDYIGGREQLERRTRHKHETILNTLPKHLSEYIRQGEYSKLLDEYQKLPEEQKQRIREMYQDEFRELGF